MKKIKISTILTTIALCIIAVFTLFPVFIAVLNSFKTQAEIGISVLSLPKNFNFSNYTSALGKMDYLRVVYNTFYITLISVVGIIAVSSLAGYKLAKTSGKLSAFIFLLFTSSMLVPFQSVMLPLYKLAKTIGLSGTKTGLTVIYMGLGINMAIFLYHGFSKGIPNEIEEAALIDGCNEFEMFYKIIFPLLRPISATIAILDVLWIWNDFMLPLVMISDTKNYTIVLKARMFVSQYIIDWPSILAALVCSMIPVIIFYVILQKNIVKGIAAGAVKG
ncbi:carbohydrate ABC transporter permease [Clostridium estertheticum]|uniref:carbohydrate ABC transporter permease n=1 Tax=Clostridium estertheticum TaxID=238834 RepID=UPI0013E94D71|nr:carbohydrate ABC transporter permease [Clostridium estertheticum]MBZ9685774.1 carbohydrate ABC transporter permease [Clostridium estertheticum]